MSALIDRLLACPDLPSQKSFVDGNLALFSETEVQALKDEATLVLRADVHRSLELAELVLYVAECADNPLYRALGLLAQGNAYTLGGLGEYQIGLERYNEAAAIYQAHDLPVKAANAQVAKLLALSNLGRYDEALATGEWASAILADHGEWMALGRMTGNMGTIYFRMGQDEQALAKYEQARDLYRKAGTTGEPGNAMARAESNRANALRNLGRFSESVEASEAAIDYLEKSGQEAEVARARQILAVTYFILGNYNDSLKLLDQAQAFFAADGRQRDAILVDLFTCECLLELGRYHDALEKSRAARLRFAEYGAAFEVGRALLDEAVANAGLRHYDDALAALEDARQLFVAEANLAWTASADAEAAAVLQRLGRNAESLEASRRAEQAFSALNLPVGQAHAALIAGRAAVALGEHDEAQQWIETAERIGLAHDLPALLYPCRQLAGLLAEGREDLDAALELYTAAVEQVERLRRRLMAEFRVDFLEDKQAIYEDVVALSLARNQPRTALEYAERAKSRVLREMLDFRLELGVRARSQQDQGLVDELKRLKSQRDLLYRHWAGEQAAVKVRGWAELDSQQRQVQEGALELEKRMTELWHRLLIHNADYAADAMLWQPQAELELPVLPADTLLLEYFSARGQGLVFAMTTDQLQVYRVGASQAQIQQMIRLLLLNFNQAIRQPPERMGALIRNAQALLHELYKVLVGPVLGRDGMGADFARWIIVPHGPLHYLPFHALYDGTHYLAERCELSYLPGASLLRRLDPTQMEECPALVLGHSFGGALPHTLEEARAVGDLLRGEVLLEDAATLAAVQEKSEQAGVLHFATHGDFRPDNPLFSGLALAGDWLTTLDIFNLRLQASLVTLSACQTGRSVIGGGDELLGLMRAFLSAGAASVLMSLWAVEDRSAAAFMTAFYEKLTQGWTKGAALRHAQSWFLEGGGADGADARTAHPYFWAPFALIGHTGWL